MPTLNIHLETFDKESFDRLESLASKGPIAISIAPYQVSRMSPYQIEKLRQILSQEGYVLGQQGLNHKCTKCAEFHREKTGKEVTKAGIDPWHENYCLWFGQISAKEQEEFMKEGRKQLKEIFLKEPELYVPPNHYFDLTTVKVAKKLGYKWLSDRALLPLRRYLLEKIIIIPESEPEISKNNQFYIHADRWEGNLDNIVARGIESYTNVQPKSNEKSMLEKNRELKMRRKIARDLNKGYGMSEENSEKCAELLCKTKFINDAFL